MRHRGADHFADPDLLRSLSRYIDHQAEQAETADKDGESRCPGQQPGDILFRRIEFGDALIDEPVVEVIVGIDIVEGLLYRSQGGGPVGAVVVAGLKGDAEDVGILYAVGDYQWFYGFP